MPPMTDDVSFTRVAPVPPAPTRVAAMGDALRSVPPHQYTHIFVAGLVFAAADAFATGANDIGACLPL